MLNHTKKYRANLRDKMRKLRAAVSGEDEKELSFKVMQKVLVHPFLNEKRLIGSYISAHHEISTANLNLKLESLGHCVALPVIDPKHKGHMDFYTYEDNSELIKNRFGILEPPPYHERYIGTDIFELVLLPLLAFDLNGNRMGMGGGYYDRLLKKLSANCITIGLAYDFQMMPAIAAEHWDMPLDEVITPSKHYIFSKKYY